METTDNSFGINLRRLIDEKGLTYGKAAGNIGISLSFLNQLMRGESHPSLPMIYQIGDKLGFPLSELFRDKEQEKSEQSKSDLILRLISILPTLDEAQLGQLLRLAESHAQVATAQGPLVSDERGNDRKRLK